ncbi:AZG1, partial [Symbiodinium sp. KB8]
MFRGGKVDNYFKVVYLSRYGLWITRFYEEQYWQVSQRGSNLTTEIRAGITTFLTAAYIMACPADV